MKSAWKVGMKGWSCRGAVGALGAVTQRNCQTASGIFSVLSQGTLSWRCCSWCNPWRTFRQSEQGYLPLKVLAMAVPTESWREKTAIMRPQAMDCNASQWPPRVATMATKHSPQPIVRMRRFIVPTVAC